MKIKFICRALQLTLLLLTIGTLAQFFYQTSKALDFALNRPLTEEEQRQTLLAELPRFFLATNPNEVIAEALEKEDYALAGVYIGFAEGLPSPLKNQVDIDEDLIKQYEASQSILNRGKRLASGCIVDGLVNRKADTASAFTCQTASSFFLVGDVADLSKEAFNYASGEEIDGVIIGLSILGIGASSLPILIPASGGTGAAKSMIKAGPEVFPIVKPLRSVVTNAIDMSAVRKQLSNFTNWKSFRRGISELDVGKFVRPSHIEKLSDGLTHISDIAFAFKKQPSEAIRALKKVDNFDELADMSKVVKIAGDDAVDVFTIMGKNSIEIKKLARPAIALAKFGYQSYLALWGSLAVILFAFLEFVIRKIIKRIAKSSRYEDASIPQNRIQSKRRGFGWIVGAFACLIIAMHLGVHMLWQGYENGITQLQQQKQAQQREMVYANIEALN